MRLSKNFIRAKAVTGAFDQAETTLTEANELLEKSQRAIRSDKMEVSIGLVDLYTA